jgi:hypothetical protein
MLMVHGLMDGAGISYLEVDMSESLLAELSSARFGDLRLSKRLGKIADRLEKKPNLSIPGATERRAEMEAAYRFFDNDKVMPEAILAPHVESTRRRIAAAEVVLLVQDTTELDLTRPEQQVQGVGPLDCESRFGLHYHPLMGFSPDGLCLGTLWSKTWTRDAIATRMTEAEKEKQRKARPIEEKESLRWLEGIRAARDVAEACPTTQCVCVADSEADLYEVFVEPRQTAGGGALHLLIRACQNRALSEAAGCLLAAVRTTPCVAQNTLDVSARRPQIKIKDTKRQAAREARLAAVEIRAASVTLRPPPRPDRKLPAVTINVVLVEEVDPPAGETPIQWLLITTLPIGDVQQVLLIVQYYCIRWQIEVYFRTLKSGCRVESRYFERLGRLQNCLAVYSIVAWKILYLCRLSRECPDLDCEVVFEPAEWKAVYLAVGKRKLPKTPPSLNEMVRMIASLGGYVIRKSTQPGTQTLWIGLQRLHDLATAWNVFGPETRNQFFYTNDCVVR